MLGVRRTSVTEVAKKIQKTGAISYSRGAIKIPGIGTFWPHAGQENSGQDQIA